MAQISPKVYYVGTGGILFDREHAAQIRRDLFPEDRVDSPTVAVFDLSGSLPTPAALKELILPLAQRIRGGQLGEMRLVICTPDNDAADFIGYLARDYDLAMFVAPTAERLSEARPVGDLTVTDHRTMDGVLTIGGTAGLTAAEFARSAGIEPAAANNRLANLTRDGFLFRLARPRSEGDLFVDPRSVEVPTPVAN